MWRERIDAVESSSQSTKKNKTISEIVVNHSFDWTRCQKEEREGTRSIMLKKSLTESLDYKGSAFVHEEILVASLYQTEYRMLCGRM